MTKAGRSNYKPFWGRCQFPRSTHTLLHFTGGEADILEAKLPCRSGEGSRAEAGGPRCSEAVERIRRKRASGEQRGVLFAHLKCAPVRRALSATDSVCSLLQDGGSAPIHFLLIASQLSLSIRLKTRRSPAEHPGTSYSISSLTNGGGRRRFRFRLLCFSTYRIQRWMWSFHRWLQRSPTWSSVCVCAPLFFLQNMFPARARTGIKIHAVPGSHSQEFSFPSV